MSSSTGARSWRTAAPRPWENDRATKAYSHSARRLDERHAHAPGHGRGCRDHHAASPGCRLWRQTAVFRRTGGQAAPAATAPGQKEAVVNVYNWSDYIEPKALEEFTAKTGIKVRYDVFDSNEVLETKLLTGNSGYDVVVPSAYFLERQIKAGVFAKLDKAQLPNLANLDPEIAQRAAAHDPNNEHSVVYMWGTTGIGYDAAKVKAIMADAPVDSWRLVFDPAVLAKFKDCGVSMLDDPTDMVGTALLYLGRIPTASRQRT